MDLNTCLPSARKLFTVLTLAVMPMAAQTGLGVVRGTVEDASKAVIPNAKVTLTNTATGVSKESQSNADGIYYFGAVQIGLFLPRRAPRSVTPRTLSESMTCL